MECKILILFIIIIIILVYILNEIAKLKKQKEKFSTISDEAIANISSLYNTGNLTVTNLKVTGEINAKHMTIDRRDQEWGSAIALYHSKGEPSMIEWFNKEGIRYTFDKGDTRVGDLEIAGNIKVAGNIKTNNIEATANITSKNITSNNGQILANDGPIVIHNIGNSGSGYFQNYNDIGDSFQLWPSWITQRGTNMVWDAPTVRFLNGYKDERK